MNALQAHVFAENDFEPKKPLFFPELRRMSWSDNLSMFVNIASAKEIVYRTVLLIYFVSYTSALTPVIYETLKLLQTGEALFRKTKELEQIEKAIDPVATVVNCDI